MEIKKSDKRTLVDVKKDKMLEKMRKDYIEKHNKTSEEDNVSFFVNIDLPESKIIE